MHLHYNMDSGDLLDLRVLKKKTSVELRKIPIEAFLDALSKSVTPIKVLGSFK